MAKVKLDITTKYDGKAMNEVKKDASVASRAFSGLGDVAKKAFSQGEQAAKSFADEVEQIKPRAISELDDEIESLAKQADEAKKAMRDMSPKSSEFKKAQAELKGINKELKELSKTRDELDDGGLGDGLAEGFDSATEGAGGLTSGLGGITAAFGPLGIAAGVAIGILTAGFAAVIGVLSETVGEYDQASRMIQAQTGATGAELQTLKEDMRAVWVTGLGDMTQAGQAIGDVNRQLKLTGDAAQDAATKAIVFEQAFGSEIPQTVNSVKNITASFGEDVTTAFDQMTIAIQETGDPAGDLVEAFGEYSGPLADAGFEVEQLTAALIGGMQAGARNGDVILDFLKEMTIRIGEGSDEVKNNLAVTFASIESPDAFENLSSQLENANQALRESETAVGNAETAFGEAKLTVEQLEQTLNNATRSLNELTQPELAGMREYDVQIRDLEKSALELETQLLKMDDMGVNPDTQGYKDVEGALADINRERDILAKEKELAFFDQLAELDDINYDATTDVRNFESVKAEALGYAESIGDIKEQQAIANQEFERTGQALEEANQEFERNQAAVDAIQQSINALGVDRVQELYDQLARGEITEADIALEIAPHIGEIDNEVLQNQVLTAIGGGVGEDLGATIVSALSGAAAGANEEINGIVTNAQGATEGVQEALTGGIGMAFEEFSRIVQDSFLPLWDEISPKIDQFLTDIEPLVQKFAEDLNPLLSDAVEMMQHMAEALGLTSENATASEAGFELVKAGLEGIIAFTEDMIWWGETLAGLAEYGTPIVEMLNEILNPLEQVRDLFEQIQNVNLPDLSGLGGIGGGIGDALGFAEGGIVPGPAGAPQAAIVHGGEMVLNQEQQKAVFGQTGTGTDTSGINAELTANFDGQGMADAITAKIQAQLNQAIAQFQNQMIAELSR